uniref:Uncharacterized protein n=1 Tax=Chromera velia CCMP2878 TaxID=1169474 RepID=A0A0G4F4F1_9ALVE|eukprot:Cvel_2742.t1-p1 / transcript=Cvel_2742.t1 / gene=Cvel_2742 / organism=Chromera_velia_CCMP2878 / gene_product=hypothetical protein / transcript_product=hypothetical protein / location=Cvel_scaffold110:16759-17118(+) / protein_length=120 / sequence_SO=supercontig / SO=protein_coding / is_pseudo=false
MSLSASSVIVSGGGVRSVNQAYTAKEASEIPEGFAKVCRGQGWDTKSTWEKLNKGKSWYGAENGAYIYLNEMDGKWWIDAPSGEGVYIAKGDGSPSPVLSGWTPLDPSYAPVPTLTDTCS